MATQGLRLWQQLPQHWQREVVVEQPQTTTQSRLLWAWQRWVAAVPQQLTLRLRSEA